MSAKRRLLPSHPLAVLAIGLALTACCIVVQSSSQVVARAAAYGGALQRVSPHHWSKRLEPDGALAAPLPLLVAVGRPRGPCDVKIDGKLAATTKGSAPGLKGRLLLDASFLLMPGQAVDVDLVCDEEPGFVASLTHEPVILPYRLGMAVELWRGGTELILGPLASCFLLVFLLVQGFSRRSVPHGSWSGRLFAFAVIALAHSLSLAYYTRLFLGGVPASTLHVVFKGLLQIAFLRVCAPFARERPLSYVLNLGLALGAVVVAVLSPTRLDAFYDYFYLIVPLTTLMATIDLLRLPPRSEAEVILRYVVTAVLVMQCLDGLVIWSGFGAYTAPSALALMAVMMALVQARETDRLRRVERSSIEMARVLHQGRGILETISELADVVMKETHFSRLSTYVDAYSLGLGASPGGVFLRLFERGYRKDTGGDARITFGEEQGLQMKKALASGEVALECGAVDHIFYLCLPLGRHACLNLSDDERKPHYIAAESEDLVKRLHPFLSNLSERLIEYGVRSGLALEKLRSMRGDGVWTVKMGAVFADVNDFSVLTEKFGEGFAAFVSGTFLPALCRLVRPWAVREFSRGDEVYLVCVQDLIEDDSLPETAVLKTVDAIRGFMTGDGARLCAQAGYPPLSITIGANVGDARLLCDSFQVRTAGEMINEASRLKDAAPKGGTLLHRNLALTLPPASRRLLGEETAVLVKKTLVFARPYGTVRVAS